MKRIVKIILIILVITLGINLLTGNVVQAESDSRRLLIEIWEEYCLADKLILTITPLENFSPSYSGSLTEFYNAGEVVLSEIESGGKAEYNFSVYFDEDAEEEYQDLTTSFDIEIGFLGKKSVKGVGEITLTHSSVTFNSATLGWITDIPSFCRVVYDEVSHPILGNPPNYGYAFSTKPTDVKKDSHRIQLLGLKPDTKYFFRIICWASPETISDEYTFKTKPLTTITSQVKVQKRGISQTSQTSQNEEEIEGKMTGTGLTGEIEKDETQEKTQKEEKGKEKEEEEEKEKDKGSKKSKKSFRARGLLAAIRNLSLNLKILLLALLIIIIILIIVWAKREKKEKKKYK